MSLEAVIWAQDKAPGIDKDPTAASVLVAYARSADQDGRGAYPTVAVVMWRTRLSARAVQRALERLLARGLIRPGDQGLVAHLRTDVRPYVYDLAMELCRDQLTPRKRRNSLAAEESDRPPRNRADIVRLLAQRDGAACRGCGLAPGDVLDLEVDHVMPRSLGGQHALSNIQLLCAPCNRSKHAKHPDQWRLPAPRGGEA